MARRRIRPRQFDVWAGQKPSERPSVVLRKRVFRRLWHLPNVPAVSCQGWDTSCTLWRSVPWRALSGHVGCGQPHVLEACGNCLLPKRPSWEAVCELRVLPFDGKLHRQFRRIYRTDGNRTPLSGRIYLGLCWSGYGSNKRRRRILLRLRRWFCRPPPRRWLLG